MKKLIALALSALLLFALLFAICHITISLKNSYAEDAKNQNNRKR